MGGTISSLCEANKAHSDDDLYDSYDRDVVVIRKLSNRQSRTPGKSSSNLTIDDFSFIKVIGEGSYGKVYLVQKKKGQKYYALKCFKKEDILMKNMLSRVFSEKDILKELKHPFLVRLRYSFQGTKKVYMAMDFCQGGDFAMHLRDRKKISEEDARFYASELVLGIQYLHEKLDVIHRDIKPENIMFGSDGHIKLTDFGLAKATQKAFSLCGTPEYVAPEIIIGDGYGKEVDWWTLGCFLYEVVVGKSPFYSDRRENMPMDIVEKTPEFPNTMSRELKDLILKLLAKEPERRLGHKGAEEVKSHSFFKGIHWEDVLKKRLRPPFVPTLTSQKDVRYFRDVADCSETPGESHNNENERTKKGNSTDFTAFSYVESESQTQNSLKDSTIKNFGSPVSDKYENKENTNRGNR